MKECFICHVDSKQASLAETEFPVKRGDELVYEIKTICCNHVWMGTFTDAITGMPVPSCGRSYYREGIVNERNSPR
jgi:hypothetical protein